MESNEQVAQFSAVAIRYGFRTVLEDFTLQIQKGSGIGLLGVNGAGKTSLIRLLLGMIRPYRGSVSLLSSRKIDHLILRRIGYAPEDASPPDFLTGEEYLEFVGSFRIVEKTKRRVEVEQLLKLFDLDPRKRVRDYSKGMKRRLVLAQAMIGDPEFLILDEPLNGLDPIIIISLRERLAEFRSKGGTLLFCSHILAEVEKLCSDVAILKEGKLAYRETVASTISNYGTVEQCFAKHHGQ